MKSGPNPFALQRRRRGRAAAPQPSASRHSFPKRVPALPAPRSASFVLIVLYTGFPRERAGPRYASHHLPHVTPSPRVPALLRHWRPPLSRFGKPAGFHREERGGGTRTAHHLPHVPLPQTYLLSLRAARLRSSPFGFPPQHRHPILRAGLPLHPALERLSTKWDALGIGIVDKCPRPVGNLIPKRLECVLRCFAAYVYTEGMTAPSGGRRAGTRPD